MQDVVTWAALAAAIAAILSIAKLSSYVTKAITEAKMKADDAAKEASDAHVYAENLSIRLSAMHAEFGLYRESVAKEYIARDSMRDFEERVMGAIDKLTGRVDRVLEVRAGG